MKLNEVDKGRENSNLFIARARVCVNIAAVSVARLGPPRSRRRHFQSKLEKLYRILFYWPHFGMRAFQTFRIIINDLA